MKVANGAQSASSDVTFGAVGPQGPQGPVGQTGAQGMLLQVFLILGHPDSSVLSALPLVIAR